MLPRIMFGPPGTGKTSAMLRLLEKELETVPAREIAFVSFTRAGANEGRERALAKFGDRFVEDDFVYFRTLHSLAFHALGMKREHVIGKKDYKAFSDKMGMRFTGYYTEELRHDDDRFLFFNDLRRNNPHAAARMAGTIDTDRAAYVGRNFRAFKDTFALSDFTDMVNDFVKRGASIPVRVAFIDEAQDLTTLQWRAVWTAFKDCERVYIAGDDDQAIYQWSGADVDYFLDLPGERTILDESFRLPDEILALSKTVSAMITKRVEKDYHGRGPGGRVDTYNALAEVPFVPGESTLVLSRNHVFLNDAEKTMLERGRMFRRGGEPIVSRDDVRAVNLYERIRKEGGATSADLLTLKKYTGEMAYPVAPWYDAFTEWPEEKTLFVRDCIAKKIDTKECSIDLDTIHAVKGKEADHVVLMLDISRNVKTNLEANPDAEHRAFYVGATRARKRLSIVRATSKHAYPLYGGA